MIRLFLATALLATLAESALADECRERFFANREKSIGASPPGAGHIVSEMKGGQTTENEYHSASWDHGLFKPIKPANMAWTLTYKGAMYNSSDEGKTWKKVHSFDAENSARRTTRLSRSSSTAPRT